MTAPLPQDQPFAGPPEHGTRVGAFLHFTPCLEQLLILVFNSISFILK